MSPRAPILAAFAANVRRYRQERGFTQEVLAEKLEISVRYLARIEAGNVNVGLVSVDRIAHALEVAPGALLYPAELPPPKPGRPRKKPTA